MSATVSIINPGCSPVFDGSATIMATGGVAPYLYSLDQTTYQSSNVFTNLMAGTYTATVKDSNDEQFTLTFVITQVQPLEINLSATLDFPSSAAFAFAFGGTPPYVYSWEFNGAPLVVEGNQEIFNLLSLTTSGNLCCRVIDTNGCMAIGCMQVDAYLPVNTQNETLTMASSDAITTSSISVLANDFVNGLPANSPQNLPTITLTGTSVPPNFILNTNGTVSVLPGTPAGTYDLMYQICYLSYPNCGFGTATINILNQGFVLNAFVDANENSIQDNNEQNFNLGQFNYELNNTGIVTTLTSSNGNAFISETVATNSYNFNYTIPSQYSSQYSCSTSYSNISNTNENVTTFNFPVIALLYDDLSVYISPNGVSPRPGFVYSNRITYKNSGNIAIPSGTITFTKDSNISIVSSSEMVTSTSQGFTFDFTNLLPNETRYLTVNFQVPTIPTVSIGQTLTNSVMISIPINDINPVNNQNSLSQIVIGSYDPNDKTESHGGKIIHSTFTSNDYLTYTIQFENTGTAEPYFINVDDVLDAKLDPTSIEMIDASHPYTMKRTQNTLSWNFQNIFLPPSNGSATIGHGYITFKVKPKSGYAVGDVIPNIANIYFDFNPAITTPVCTTEFVTSLSKDEFTFTDYKIYPNPFTSVLTVSNNSIIEEIEISSIMGQKIIDEKVNQLQYTIDLSDLTPGVYFAKVKSNGVEKWNKIMKK